MKNIKKPGQHSPKLLDQVRERICVKHYSNHAETQYVQWVKPFIFISSKAVSREIVAVEGNVSSSTQYQA